MDRHREDPRHCRSIRLVERGGDAGGKQEGKKTASSLASRMRVGLVWSASCGNNGRVNDRAPCEHPSPGERGGGADSYSSREKTIWLGAALLLLTSVVVAIFVFGGASEGDGPGEVASAEGVLVQVEEERLRLRLARPLDGRSEIDFAVEPRDRATLNIAHLQLHASDGLPTRIYYERDGDRYVARGAQDLPGLP
jgi:hypothetical protein